MVGRSRAVVDDTDPADPVDPLDAVDPLNNSERHNVAVIYIDVGTISNQMKSSFQQSQEAHCFLKYGMLRTSAIDCFANVKNACGICSIL